MSLPLDPLGLLDNVGYIVDDLGGFIAADDGVGETEVLSFENTRQVFEAVEFRSIARLPHVANTGGIDTNHDYRFNERELVVNDRQRVDVLAPMNLVDEIEGWISVVFLGSNLRRREVRKLHLRPTGGLKLSHASASLIDGGERMVLRIHLAPDSTSGVLELQGVDPEHWLAKLPVRVSRRRLGAYLSGTPAVRIDPVPGAPISYSPSSASSNWLVTGDGIYLVYDDTVPGALQ